VDSGPSKLAPGTTFNLNPQTTIGRGPTNTIQINESFVSGEHTRISYRNGAWYVQDAGSVNGTYLNNQPAKDALAARVGDIIQIGFIRFKLALTEDGPAISAYDEAAWAKLSDSRLPIDISLVLISAIHIRLVWILEAMSDADFEKSFRHPERGPVTLANNLALYSWHSKHHTAHVTRLRERMGW